MKIGRNDLCPCGSGKLRFKADDGSEFPEWEEKRLGEVLESKSIKQVPSDDVPLMAFIARKGVTDKGERYDRSFLVKNDDKKYKKTDYNDFIYSSNNLDVGSIGLNKYGSAVISDVYEIFSFKPGYIPDCINLLIQCPKTMARILSFRQGCLYGQYRIYASDFLSVKSMFPSLPEQRKIASFLSTIDEIIQSTESELTAWQERKKGVMQKIFNREVRFKADDGSEFPEWEEKKFGDIWKRIMVKNDGSFGGDKIISVANMKWAPKDDVRDDYLKTYNLLPSNAIAFEGHRNNSYSYGRFVLNDIGDGIVSHVFVCFEPIADIIPAFWKEYIHAECVMGRILRKCTKSSTMMHDLVVLDFLKHTIFVPSLPEQRKIADCLSSLDDVINQIKAELSAWKEFKKGLLQQMFV